MNKSVTKEANIKTGISINRGLAEDADTLAREMGVTRSGLYAMALREFIRRRESASLLEKLNDAYREPDPEDEPLLRGIKRHGRRVLDEEER
jgi:hypothetical protein